MTVFAANMTKDSLALIEDLLRTPEFLRFSLQSKLNLQDNTVLIRLAIINLVKNLPDSDGIREYKAALLRPGEFDDWLKNQSGDTLA